MYDPSNLEPTLRASLRYDNSCGSPVVSRQIQAKLLVAGGGTILLTFAVFSRDALAYIDPGTSQVIWTTLAPVIGVLLGCVVILLTPVRIVWRHLRSGWKRCSRLAKLAAITITIGAVVSVVFVVSWLVSRGDEVDTMSSGGVGALNWKRAIVLGMDGLDPNLLERMMDAGKLPNFSRLRKEGTFARLQTSTPPESPVAWLCAATGVNPGRHGVFDFIGRDPKRYLPELTVIRPNQKGAFALRAERFVPVTSRPAFWDMLSENGIKVSVIRWPMTFPARPVNGRLLSGLGTPDVAGTLGCYHFYTTAPIGPDDKAPERATAVRWGGNVINTDLPGPRILALTGGKTSTAPLRIERSTDAGSVTIRIGEADPVSLRTGEWSEWVQVRFPGGLSRDCPAAVKMYLTSLEPELALYVTPPQIDPRDPAFPIGHPEDFPKKLAERIGPYYTLGIPEDTQAVRHGRIPLAAFLEQCDQVTRERELMLAHELDRFKEGLLAIVFDTSDRIQHMFWGIADPSHPAHVAALENEFGGIIEEHYRRMDGVLEKVLNSAGGDTAVFVMSDHGFTDFKRAVHLNTWLAQNGFMTLAASSGEDGAPLLKSVDWPQTQAYAVGFCSLYLNVRRREGHGTVSEDEEYRQVREEISRGLKAWTDPRAGEPIVRSLYAREEVFQGSYLDRAPDLVIGYYPGYRASWQTALGAAPAGDPVVDNDDLWSGDHLVDGPCVPGVFLSSVKCRNLNPRLIDIAPTVLRTFNTAASPDMDGKPLF